MTNFKISHEEKMIILKLRAQKNGNQPELFTPPERIRQITKTVLIYSDGGCVPNPGFGAWCAAFIEGGQAVKALSGTEQMTTSNRMEVTGIIKALETLTEPHRVLLRSDSMYVVDAINKWMAGWIRQSWMRKEKKILVPVKNSDLWQHLHELRQYHELQAEWVRGHNGDAHNEYCDMICEELILENK